MTKHPGIAACGALAVASALAFSSPAFAQGMAMKGAPAKSDLAHAIVGTWRVTGFSRVDVATNKVTYPIGQHPLGYMVFTPGGHMAAMITASERKKPKLPYTDADRSAILLDIPVAYVGPYKIQGNQMTVHEVTTLRPDNVGLDSLRTVEINGNTLTIKNAPAKNSVTGKMAVAIMTGERLE